MTIKLRDRIRLDNYAVRARKHLQSRLPLAVRRFIGLDKRSPSPPTPLRLLTIFIATMAGMLVGQAVVLYAPLYRTHWKVTTIVPSFGASCILVFNAIASPLAQPRNLFFGQFLSGLIGVGVTKLFMERAVNEQYLWLSAALSVAISSVVMDITGTVHPPAGATALLPSLDAEFRRMGWNLLPDLLIMDCLFLGVALICNNVFRKYPAYWFFPPQPDVTAAPTAEREIVVTLQGVRVPPDVALSDDAVQAVERIQALLAETKIDIDSVV